MAESYQNVGSGRYLSATGGGEVSAVGEPVPLWDPQHYPAGTSFHWLGEFTGGPGPAYLTANREDPSVFLETGSDNNLYQLWEVQHYADGMSFKNLGISKDQGDNYYLDSDDQGNVLIALGGNDKKSQLWR